MGPKLFGTVTNEEKVKETTSILKASTEMIENYFLKKTKFISSDSITIADLQALCEYTEYCLSDFDPIKDHPRLAQWLEDCKGELQPHFDDCHKTLYSLRDKLASEN